MWISLRVTIRFFSTVREVIGKREETLEFRDNKVTLEIILRRLAERYGKDFTKYVYDSKVGVQSLIIFIVNSRIVNKTPNWLNTKLTDGDVLEIIPSFGGG